MTHSDTHMRMQTHRHTFKDSQKDTKKHSDTRIEKHTKIQNKDTYIKVQRPTIILKDMHTQRYR